MRHYSKLLLAFGLKPKDELAIRLKKVMRRL